MKLIPKIVREKKKKSISRIEEFYIYHKNIYTCNNMLSVTL